VARESCMIEVVTLCNGGAVVLEGKCRQLRSKVAKSMLLQRCSSNRSEDEEDVNVTGSSRAYRCDHMYYRMEETAAGEPFDMLSRECT